MIFDTFMINEDLDMLECRLTELEAVPDLVHVAVEADVDHQDHPKPYHLTDNRERFDAWSDRLVIVRATDLPTASDDPDPWARELAQREWVRAALDNADPSDVILHGDVDEIPTVLVANNIRHMQPNRAYSFTQRMHCFAVDWQHPDPWPGTVAAHWGGVREIPFGSMRAWRNYVPPLANGGWHLSWVGGKDAALKKLGSFCHPEIADRTLAGIEQDIWLDQGWHVDGVKMIPVDVDNTWPRWVREGNCPESWYRTRGVEATSWTPPPERVDVH